MYSKNILESIEETLPSDCELLIRTNHDPDGLSGAPKENGKWFVHLIASSGHKKNGNVKHESIYNEYGDNLFQMLIRAAKCADNWNKKSD